MGVIVLVVASFIILGHVLAMSIPAMELDLGTIVVSEEEISLHKEEVVRNEKKVELENAEARLHSNDASEVRDDHASMNKLLSAEKIEREKKAIEDDLLLLGQHKKHDSVQEEMDENARREFEQVAERERAQAAKQVPKTRVPKTPSKSRTKKQRPTPVPVASDLQQTKDVAVSPGAASSTVSPGAASTTVSSGAASKPGLVFLLSSHQRLVLYDVDRDVWSDVDGDHGNYYGLLPGRTSTKVLVSRTINVGPTPDAIMEIDLLGPDGSGFVRSTDVHTRYMHDAVRTQDGAAVIVVDVSGIVHVLKGSDLSPVKMLPVFTRSEHINTIAPTDHGTAWVVLHNVGPSKVVELDLSSGYRLCTLEQVGKQAHGFVLVDGGAAAIMLSSKDAALVRVEIPSSCRGQVSMKATVNVLWQHEQEDGQAKFLKGLAVVDRVAYFGMSDFKSSRGERARVATSLVAVNIDTGEKLWERAGLGTRGIVNIIGAPFVSVNSTWRELSREEFSRVPEALAKRQWRQREAEAGLSASEGWPIPEKKDLPLAQDTATSKSLLGTRGTEASLASKVTNEPSQEELENTGMRAESGNVQKRMDHEEEEETCLAPTLKTIAEAKIMGHAYGHTRTEDAFVELPLQFDVQALAAELDVLYQKYNFTYRADVNNYFLLLVTNGGRIEQSRIGPFEAVPNRLSLAPYTRKVLDSFGAVVGRSRYMMLKSGEEVKRHTDDVVFEKKQRGRPRAIDAGSRSPSYGNGYWGRRFRVHIPVITHEKVTFGSGKSEIYMKPGHAYLFDNGNFHWVKNDSPIDRVHLIFDTVGSRSLFELIEASTIHKKSGEVVPGSAKRMILPDPEHDVKVTPLVEQWADGNAMEPMSATAIARFVDSEILSRISDLGVRDKVKAAFDDFKVSWTQSCTAQTVAGGGVPEACETIARTLLDRVGAETECLKKGVGLDGSLGMRIFDATQTQTQTLTLTLVDLR
ncbi:Hypothetical Protein FCC1311_046952 [Hondaea fermentalgiana]|uniref:Aspartyl/asparaginy/proline hydroxylase domain-containing protein n=1 Tax=Hondaea fermentalgiana TaxID=2315210 RepID=A0A2R5GBV3_9STRA|nr:Hypothetical Protein FCC1311_046952 [Hondaea fermentalgiana]|eukprot:GBG28472.1 Hypothetical Protein FCC1311_046952 [Hondaea fermentalgiana]